MVTTASGIYVGTVRHRRFTPRPHQFNYSVFMALLDIDSIDALMTVSPFTSVDRFNWASFNHRDHLDDPCLSLRDRLWRIASEARRTLPNGRIYLLTHLRYAGYVFNPISLYYCFDSDGILRSVVADVRNTYGGRRSYWLDPLDASTHRFHATAPKMMYVSPFMDRDVSYEFLLSPPEESLTVHMNVDAVADGARIFDATLRLERRPWTAASIAGTLWAYPFMTARVIGAIHFEALRLWFKGLQVKPAPEGRR